MIFDSHSHYDDTSFNDDREEVLRDIQNNGVIGILNCGSDIRGMEMSAKLAKENDFIYAAVGLHPEFALDVNSEVLKRIEELAKEDKVRAIGEIGLDYHFEENPPREDQKAAFRAQMDLASKLNLPVIIHDRDAHGDTLEIMKEFKGVRGSVHCFSGSKEFAMECIKLGYYIGVTGVITFKNSKTIKEVVKAVPLDRLLVETDCPYMTPVPFRGKRNQSDYIKYIIEQIALIKEVSTEEVEQATIRNIKELLSIGK